MPVLETWYSSDGVAERRRNRVDRPIIPASSTRTRVYQTSMPGQPVTPTPTQPIDDEPWTPKSYPSAAALVAGEGLPTDANYVTWTAARFGDQMLEEIFMQLSANDVLVLPERDQPYLIDSSDGFRAANVSAVQGKQGTGPGATAIWLPVVNTYLGKPARTFFGMARARRGLVGLGPGTRIGFSDSTWTMQPQIRPKGRVESDGWVSPGRFYRDAAGNLAAELNGCPEQVMAFDHAKPIFGNLICEGAENGDFGGLAYSGITTGSNRDWLVFRTTLNDFHRGFLGIPNGEAGGLGANGRYTFRGVKVITRNAAGVKNASSPIMVNRSPGGSWTDVWCDQPNWGMPTIWGSSGLHTLTNVWSGPNEGHGINLEHCEAGFAVRWVGGQNFAHAGNGFHIGLQSSVQSVKVELIDVATNNGYQGRPEFSVQVYDNGLPKYQLASDITLTRNGVPQTVRVYNALA